MGECSTGGSGLVQDHDLQTRVLFEMIDQARQRCGAVAEEEGGVVRWYALVGHRRQAFVEGVGSAGDAGAVELDSVLSASRRHAHLGRLLLYERLEMVVQLGVQHLFGGGDVQRIESGGPNEGLGNDPSPGVPETEQADSALGVDGFSDKLLAVLELRQDCAMEVEVKVEMEAEEAEWLNRPLPPPPRSLAIPRNSAS